MILESQVYDSEKLLEQKLLGLALDYEFHTHGQRQYLQQSLSGNKYNIMIMEQKLREFFYHCANPWTLEG